MPPSRGFFSNVHVLCECTLAKSLIPMWWWQYLEVRTELVKFVAHIADRLEIANDTVQQCMAYLDRIGSHIHQSHGLKSLVVSAAACLLLATKFMDTAQGENGHSNVPSLSHLLAAMGSHPGITKKIMAAYETKILGLLGWRLLAATPFAFAHAYHAKGLFCQVDKTLYETSPSALDEQRVYNHVRFFCELGTLHGMSCTLGVSVCAASAVAAARTASGIEPAWPQELALRLGHPLSKIKVCQETMLNEWHNHYSGLNSNEHHDTGTDTDAEQFQLDTSPSKPQDSATPTDTTTHATINATEPYYDLASTPETYDNAENKKLKRKVSPTNVVSAISGSYVAAYINTGSSDESSSSASSSVPSCPPSKKARGEQEVKQGRG